jgi:hypothetical protein
LADRETLDGLTVTEGPTGETVVASETVPVNPLMLVTAKLEVPVVPWPKLRLLGFAERMKSGVVLVEKTAVWTVSGTDAALPFATVTQTPPETLV